jgi:hypothetical protein
LVEWIKKWYTIFLGIPILVLAILALREPWDIIWTILVSSIISIIAFYLTATKVNSAINDERLQKINQKIIPVAKTIAAFKTNEYKDAPTRLRLVRYYGIKSRLKGGLTPAEKTNLQNLKQELVQLGVPENQESPAAILGMGGLYAVVNGLGITEALTNYAGSLGGSIAGLLPYSLRLLTFLVTIVPFIHGFILTFSNRWYYDEDTDTTHYEWAFVFFIVVFFQTVLLFFAAVNVQKFELFFFMLWSLMVFNAPWLSVQIYYILKDKINIVNVFPRQWIILNFNTAAFLSILVFASDQLNTAAQNDILVVIINALIFIVLLSRSISDYKVGWKDLYNRPPDPKEL